ncbi:MAG: zf-HC2 domain-containing protein [Rubrivivax sp.]|nr:zf-HC2 domain-containing protein [Pyrinomonadaceae bacterium]
MDCAKSLELLSEFRDGFMADADRVLVSAHLALCPPCMGISKDLDSIVAAAAAFFSADQIAFPDETVIWERVSIKRTVH